MSDEEENEIEKLVKAKVQVHTISQIKILKTIIFEPSQQ